MDSSGNNQDVPQRVLDMVRMFLASSTRGDHTVLTLETRNQQIVTKYRSVETVAGNSATTANTPATDKNRKTVNPARAMAQLDSRERLGRLSADHMCKVSLRRPFGGTKENLSWPEMPMGDDVFRELKKIA